MNDAPLPKTELLRYSFIAFPLAFAGLPLYVHAPDFYVREVGLDLTVLGVLLLLIRFIDAIQDPFIGYISDKYAAKRHMILFAGVCALAIGFLGLFVYPSGLVGPTFWFLGFMFLATCGFSILSINVNTLGGLWRRDYNEKTRIAAWRESLGLIGVLFASVLPALLMLRYAPQMSLVILSLIFTVLLVFAFCLFLKFLGHSYIDKPDISLRRHRINFLSLFKTHSRFYFGFFVSSLASALPAVLILFFVKDYINAPEYVGLFLFLYFLSGAAFIKLWLKLSVQYGKRNAWLASMVLAVLTFAGAVFLGEGDIWPFAIVCVLSGIALGADLALPPSILADKVQESRDDAHASKHYAALSFLPKCALALASGLTFIILDQIGFIVGKDNSTEAKHGLLILYAAVPCILKLCAVLVLWRLSDNKGDNNNAYYERSTDHGTIRFS